MGTFLTSDYHLGEDRFQIMQRPFSTTEEMVDRLVFEHNRLVEPSDKVIIVGDLVYKNRPEHLSEIARFNGKKTLIRGNHDAPLSDSDLSKYFEDIVEDGGGIELEVEGIPCFATHYPTQSRKDRFNLVGHIHSGWKVQLNMLNVGVDVHHFRPVPLSDVPFYFTAIKKYYDEDMWVAYHKSNKAFVGKRGAKGRYFKPAARKPAARKPAARKPAARKPTARKPTARRK